MSMATGETGSVVVAIVVVVDAPLFIAREEGLELASNSNNAIEIGALRVFRQALDKAKVVIHLLR